MSRPAGVCIKHGSRPQALHTDAAQRWRCPNQAHASHSRVVPLCVCVCVCVCMLALPHWRAHAVQAVWGGLAGRQAGRQADKQASKQAGMQAGGMLEAQNAPPAAVQGMRLSGCKCVCVCVSVCVCVLGGRCGCGAEQRLHPPPMQPPSLLSTPSGTAPENTGVLVCHRAQHTLRVCNLRKEAGTPSLCCGCAREHVPTQKPDPHCSLRRDRCCAACRARVVWPTQSIVKAWWHGVLQMLRFNSTGGMEVTDVHESVNGESKERSPSPDALGGPPAWLCGVRVQVENEATSSLVCGRLEAACEEQLEALAAMRLPSLRKFDASFQARAAGCAALGCVGPC